MSLTNNDKLCRKLVPRFILPLLFLLVFSTLIIPVQGLEVKADLKGVSIVERTIQVVETVYQDLGGVYSLRLKGPSNPYYCGKNFLLYLNESAEFQFELEVHEAPSGFEINLNNVKVSWSCAWKDIELDVKEAKLLKTPISIRPGQSYRATFVVRPYEKGVMPIGGVESCQMGVRIFGNATFGKNVKDFTWNLREVSAAIYVMKPEDELQVEVEPDLRFTVNNGRIWDVIAGARVTVRNNLDSDLTLQHLELEVSPGSCGPLYNAWVYKKQEINKVVKVGGSETVNIKETGIPLIVDKRNGCLLLILHYLTDEGAHRKKFIYIFDLQKIYSSAPKSEPRSTTTHTSESLVDHVLTGGGPLTSELGSMVSSLIIWIILIALIFFVAGALFVARRRAGQHPSIEPHPPESLEQYILKRRDEYGRMRAAGRKLSGPSPPPQDAPIHLKKLYGHYLTFEEFLQKGRPRYALLSLREGLAAALRQLAYSLGLVVDVAGISGDPSAEMGTYAKILLEAGAIDQNDFDQIMLAASLIGRGLHRGALTSSELARVAESYIRVYNSLLKKFEGEFRGAPSYIG